MWKETLEISVCEVIAIKDTLVSATCRYQSYHYGPIIVSKRYDFVVDTYWTPYAPGAPNLNTGFMNDVTLLNATGLMAFFVSNPSQIWQQ